MAVRVIGGPGTSSSAHPISSSGGIDVVRQTLPPGGALALLVTLSHVTASAKEIKTVFVIAMENHNWAG